MFLYSSTVYQAKLLSTNNLRSIFKKTYSFNETRKIMIELGIINIKNNKMSDLVDRFAQKT